MKLYRNAVLASVMVLSLVGCQKKSVDGVYTLDKEQFTKDMEATIEKLPADKKEFGKLSLAMVSAMNVSLLLTKDGKVEMKTSLGKDTPQVDVGTWKQEGSKLALVTRRGNNPEDRMDCIYDGRIVCENESKEKFYFVR